MQYAASQLSVVNSTTGDLFVPNKAYFAMVDTVAGLLGNKNRGFKKDFNTLCSSSTGPGVQPGCAMFAFNIDAGNNRDISTYFYQVSCDVMRCHCCFLIFDCFDK